MAKAVESPARPHEAGHTAGAKPHSKNHRTVRAPGTGLSSFLQLQPLGKSQRIAIAPMHSEQPRSSFRHHRTTGGQYPHAKLHPLPLASSKNHLKSAEANLRPKLQLFCDYGLSQGAKTRILVRKRRESATKRPIFCLAGSRWESLIAKKLQKHSVFCFRNGSIAATAPNPPKDAGHYNPKKAPYVSMICIRVAVRAAP